MATYFLGEQSDPFASFVKGAGSGAVDALGNLMKRQREEKDRQRDQEKLEHQAEALGIDKRILDPSLQKALLEQQGKESETDAIRDLLGFGNQFAQNEPQLSPQQSGGIPNFSQNQPNNSVNFNQPTKNQSNQSKKWSDFTPEQKFIITQKAPKYAESLQKEEELAQKQKEKSEELPRARQKIITEQQAKNDISFAAEQEEKFPRFQEKRSVLNQAAELNKQGTTGKLWDQSMQSAGLLQFTSDGYRTYASLAKDSVKNAGIKDTIGSQISAMEFQFFRDATINERFSDKANEQIIQKELAAIEMQELYSNISNRIVSENGGIPPVNLQKEVNQQFAKESKPLTNKVKASKARFDAIQNIPKGKVLMFDPDGNPLHVDENMVATLVKKGATLK